MSAKQTQDLRERRFQRLKEETAMELGIQLKPQSGEKISARDAGRLGGNMVRKMIGEYKRAQPRPSESIK